MHESSDQDKSALQGDASSVHWPAAPTTAPVIEPAGSALTRLLQILDLFSLERPLVRMEQVASSLQIVQSTAYRYLKELCDAGLLTPQGKGVYGLGRRILELERLLALSDPLLLAGRAVIDEMVSCAQNRAILLCAYYKDATLCLHKVGPEAIMHGRTRMQILRGRGTVLGLFSGAGSHAILANLPAHQIKSVYLANAHEIAQMGLGADWQAFRRALAAIRTQGYAQTLGKINPGMHSLAVPILRADGKVCGSLLVVGSAEAAQRQSTLELLPLLQTQASKIANAMNLQNSEL